MAIKKDWVGYQYNTFTVLKEDLEWKKRCEERKRKGEIKRYNNKYICRCECGNIISIGAISIAKNRPLSCGCKLIRYAQELTNKKFGRWTVLYRDLDREILNKKRGITMHDYWICQCECGKVSSVMGSHLRSGASQSCGCLSFEKVRESRLKDITNQKFGKLLALERTSKKTHNGYVWLCLCDCGNTIEAPISFLTSGKITECLKCRSCGFETIRSFAMYKRNQENIKANGSLYDDLLNKFTEEEIFMAWSDKNKLMPNEFTRKSHQPIYLICPNCGEEYETSGLALLGRSHQILCVSCLQKELDSSFEKEVKHFLNEELLLETLHEGKCTIKLINPRTNGTLLFDNEIPELKILIEVHGQQHYEPITYEKWLNGKTPEQWLEELQWRDNYKKCRAIELGYHYLCVPYWEILDGTYKNKILEFIEGVKANASD